jgi:hypothetical protein
VVVFGGDADEKRQTLLVKKFGSRMAQRTRTAAKDVTDTGLLLTAAFLWVQLRDGGYLLPHSGGSDGAGDLVGALGRYRQSRDSG